MAKRPPLTKSPLALAKATLAVANEALGPYSHRFSRHDFTQAQIFTILVLRQFFRVDYRGIVAILQDSSDPEKCPVPKKAPTLYNHPEGPAEAFKKNIFQGILAGIFNRAKAIGLIDKSDTTVPR